MGNVLSRNGSLGSVLGKRRADYDDRDNVKRMRTEPTETDAGITAFVNPTLPGFRGIIKYRIEDFLVHEVDLDGHVVRLTSLDASVIEQKENEIKARTPPMSESEFDNHIAQLFGENLSKQLRTLLNATNDTETVLTFEFTKEQRFAFYDAFDQLQMEKKPQMACKDGVLTVKWPKDESEKGRDPAPNYAALGGEYLQFHVYKSGVENAKAVSWIAQYANVKEAKIGYAGTKDARAVTVQAMTIQKARVKNLLQVREELNKRNIYIGDFDYVPNRLTLGDLKGNRFSIVLRDVSGISEQEIVRSIESLKENGFINYFGMQRFGTGAIMTHEIGYQILKKDFQEACELILKPRPGERSDFENARNTWQETKDAEQTLKLLPRAAASENALLRSYIRFPNNHKKAIFSLPRRMLSMYLHAYQSYVWNHVVSERIKRFGCDKPLVGDLVLEDTDNATKNKFSGRGRGRGGSAGRRLPTMRKQPKVLTEDDLNSYTIEDVVYPIPGHRTVYPKNEMGDIYRDLLEKDQIVFDKSEQYLKDLSGDYRPMLAKADDLEWSLIHYNDPYAPLCYTDLDKLTNKSEPTNIPGK
ncbi:tRNA pseudouridine synthase D [Lichtheimia hyalospora FSU 10163]|nr:tRNA pseudouridine synthase D [Lichtheimia hyalospora FSU 10163]